MVVSAACVRVGAELEFGGSLVVLSMPDTQYARSGDVHIAYQVFGDGPQDVVVIPGWVTHVEMLWEGPYFRRFFEALSAFARVAIFDKRGTGLSDRNVGIAPLEERMDDTRAVMDACGMDQASIIGFSEGGPMALLFASTFPERVNSLVVQGAMPTWQADPGIPGADKAHEFAVGMLRAVDEGWGTSTLR